MKKVIFLFLLFFNISCSYLPSMLKENIDIDKPYNWYKTQAGTGEAEQNNCGPACVSMLIKFYYNLDISIEKIRNNYFRKGDWWTFKEIKQSLDLFKIFYKTKKFIDKETLLLNLNNGNLIILCLNMSKIKYANDLENKYDKFYEGVVGHFIILKGYDKKWFKVYDPNNWNNHFYKNGESKGKNRLYSIDEVYKAAKSWSSCYIVTSSFYNM